VVALSDPTPEAVASARWYGGKGRAIAAVSELDRLELGGGVLRVLSVLGEDGRDERYLWVDGAVGESLAGLVAEGADRGEFSFRRGPGLPDLGPAPGERPIGHDQSNTSLVVGEQVVVKLYRRLEAGAHPEVELGAHLTARGLHCVPAYAGSVHWGDHPLALLQEYVPDAEQGWEWCGRLVAQGDASPLRAVGKVVAEMHAALAELGARPATSGELAAWRLEAELQLDRASEAVDGEAHELLTSSRAQILGLLAGLSAPTVPAIVQRVHGDLHIGQVLHSRGALVVVDLEGEPGRPLADRVAPGLVLRDVAAMLRSFDHLARYVQREQVPGLAVEGWIEDARRSFLEGYGEVDPGLLHALEVEKECYEFTYAAAYLPEWTYTAVGGMRWLLDIP
jgi:predicted trehalose synthase